MLFGAWLEQWLLLTSSRCRPGTVAAYKSALAHLPQHMRETDVSCITAASWEAAICACAAQFPRQAQLLHAAMRKAWNDGQRLGVIPTNLTPWRFVQVPKHRAHAISYLLPTELSSYAAAACETPAALPLMLMLVCGLRRGEALALKWSKVDTRGLFLVIDCQLINGQECPPKSRTSDRIVPITAAFLDFINEKRDKSDDLCYNGSVECLYSCHRKALEIARIPAHVTLHGLRHSCATACLAAGADIKTVQSVLGHASYQITADIYCHACKDTERAAIAGVLQLLADPPKFHALMPTRLEIA